MYLSDTFPNARIVAKNYNIYISLRYFCISTRTLPAIVDITYFGARQAQNYLNCNCILKFFLYLNQNSLDILLCLIWVLQTTVHYFNSLYFWIFSTDLLTINNKYDCISEILSYINYTNSEFKIFDYLFYSYKIAKTQIIDLFAICFYL